MKNLNKMNLISVFSNIFFILFCLLFIVPFLLIISISFTNEMVLQQFGYSLIPKQFDLSAYRMVFENPKAILNAYAVTSTQAILGTILSLFLMSICGFVLSRPNFKFKKIITFYIFFTMLFSGGLIPSYILFTKYYKLGNNFWVYILPTLASPYYIFIIRTFMNSLPQALTESAKLDGAREFAIFTKIIIPLSKPVLATVGLIILLGKWNDWMTSLVYIRDEQLYTLQYLLQRILREVEFINNIASEGAAINMQNQPIPTETMRFAMCVVAAGPMLVIFPFFQKYFTKGLTVGAVKG